jgi:hypothetical protein
LGLDGYLTARCRPKETLENALFILRLFALMANTVDIFDN